MTPGRRRAAVLAAAAIFFLAFILRTAWAIRGHIVFTLIDDAMISMTYARNLATGHGLRWTMSGPAVEGYTNFGWTLWMALVHLLPIGDRFTALVVMLSGAAILVGNIWVVGRIVDRIAAGRDDVATAAMLLSGFGYALVFWTLRGMEVGLLALLVDGAVLCALDADRAPTRGRVVAVGALLALAVLTRSDALVAAAVIALWLGASLVRRGLVALAFVVPALVVATALAHTLFRWRYYGYPLPNTYYLKLGGIPLTTRLARGFDTLADELLGGLLVAVVVAVLGWRARRRGLGLCAALFAAQCAYSVWVGGDSWEDFGFLNRFLAQAWPALAVVAAFGLAEAVRARVVAAAALLLVLCDGSHYKDWLENGARYSDIDARFASYAFDIRDATREGARVAIAWAGLVPYFSHRDGVDLLGKCDTVIAHGPPADVPFIPGHDKWNVEHSIVDEKPDVVFLIGDRPPIDDQWLLARGYRLLGGRLYARRDSPLVR